MATAATGYVMLTAGFLVVGFAITRMFDSTLGVWDMDVAEWLVDRRTATWNDVTAFGSTIGDTIPVIAVAVVVSGAFLLVRRDPRPLALIATGLVIELLVFLSVSYIVDRPRPPVERLGATPSTGSFPSGHAAASVILYVGIALVISAAAGRRVFRLVLVPFGASVAVVVGLSRAYRGMHYMSDVVAGWLLGSLCLLLAVHAVGRAFEHPEPTPQPGEINPVLRT